MIKQKAMRLASKSLQLVHRNPSEYAFSQWSDLNQDSCN